MVETGGRGRMEKKFINLPIRIVRHISTINRHSVLQLQLVGYLVQLKNQIYTFVQYISATLGKYIKKFLHTAFEPFYRK